LDVFGRRLRAYRKLKHWTQIELAEKVGVSVAIIGGLERGTRYPNKALVERLCDVLQVSPAELLGEDSDFALQLKQGRQSE
jgi:transcriptional regulator with XRE-family HTH domain